MSRSDTVLAAKCLIAIVLGLIGFSIFYVENDSNPKVPLLAALIFGFGGQWLLWRLARWIKLSVFLSRGE